MIILLILQKVRRILAFGLISKFKWDQHQQNILNKAHQMFDITKRTCHVITDAKKRRSLYLSLVRSQFEHCSILIWRPVTETAISAFEKLQKKAIKWIFNELYQHYDNETYLLRCSQIKIVPMLAFFDINDLVFFHKIVNNKIPFSLPDYIHPYSGKNRLRQSNLDSLSYIITFVSNSANFSSRSPFSKVSSTKFYTPGTVYHFQYEILLSQLCSNIK